MKQLRLDTSYITPTGDKNMPVRVRKTISGIAINGLATVMFAASAFLKWQRTMPADRDTYFWIIFIVICLASVFCMLRTVKGEDPTGNLDTDNFVNLQQFALYLWRRRMDVIIWSLIFSTILLKGFADDMVLSVIIILGFIALICSRLYFKKQIKQARSLPADLNLEPRMTIQLTITPFIRNFEILAVVSVILTIAFCTFLGINNSPLTGNDNGMWIWCATAIVCSIGITASELYALHHPINVADQEEADKAEHDKWQFPIMSIALNIDCCVILYIATLLVN